MSNPPNIKLMNRSCFDRKRFAVLLHEDWAARRTRCLVTLAAGYLLLSAILTVSCLKAYSENATLLQTVPTNILEDKFAHLTDTATNQNAAFVTVTAFFFLFLIFTPWLWNAPIYNKGSTSGTCCSQPPRSRSSPDGGSIPFLFRFWQAFLLFWRQTSPVSSFATWPSWITASPVPSSLLPDFIRPPPALCSGCSSRPVCWAKPFPPEAKRDGHPCTAHSANAQSCCCPSF